MVCYYDEHVFQSVPKIDKKAGCDTSMTIVAIRERTCGILVCLTARSSWATISALPPDADAPPPPEGKTHNWFCVASQRCSRQSGSRPGLLLDEIATGLLGYRTKTLKCLLIISLIENASNNLLLIWSYTLAAGIESIHKWRFCTKSFKCIFTILRFLT